MALSLLPWLLYTVKVKVLPVSKYHALKVHWDSWGKTPCTSHFDTKQRWGVSCKFWPLWSYRSRLYYPLSIQQEYRPNSACLLLKTRKIFLEDQNSKTVSWYWVQVRVVSVAQKLSMTEEWHKEQNCLLQQGDCRNSGSKPENCSHFHSQWSFYMARLQEQFSKPKTILVWSPVKL
jgi:hypothetical protein